MTRDFITLTIQRSSYLAGLTPFQSITTVRNSSDIHYAIRFPAPTTKKARCALPWEKSSITHRALTHGVKTVFLFLLTTRLGGNLLSALRRLPTPGVLSAFATHLWLASAFPTSLATTRTARFTRASPTGFNATFHPQPVNRCGDQ